MKTNFFTKIENKIYFKVTTAFWHILIGIGALAIVIGILLVLWNYIPTSKQEVKKQPIPEKQKYPSAVTVSYNELNDIITMLNEEKKKSKPTITEVHDQPQTINTAAPQKPINVEDMQGEKEFKASIEQLKKIISPEKYKIWERKGTYYYPQGEVYWEKTHNEAYRHFNETQPGLEDRLKATANNYSDRKKLVDGYITALTPLTEESRPALLEFLISHRENNIDKATALAQALAKIYPALKDIRSEEVLNALVNFSWQNANEGIPFIKYAGTIIEKFDSKERDKIIYTLENNFYSHYNNHLQNQIEATDLFLPMLSKFSADDQREALEQYYKMYVGKNISRASQIDQIDKQYVADTTQINQKYIQDQVSAEMDYQIKENKKSENRSWWYRNIGIGILVIILISNILVIFNMQRTLKKIDEKMESPDTKI